MEFSRVSGSRLVNPKAENIELPLKNLSRLTHDFNFQLKGSTLIISSANIYDKTAELFTVFSRNSEETTVILDSIYNLIKGPAKQRDSFDFTGNLITIRISKKHLGNTKLVISGLNENNKPIFFQLLRQILKSIHLQPSLMEHPVSDTVPRADFRPISPNFTVMQALSAGTSDSRLDAITISDQSTPRDENALLLSEAPSTVSLELETQLKEQIGLLISNIRLEQDINLKALQTQLAELKELIVAHIEDPQIKNIDLDFSHVQSILNKIIENPEHQADWEQALASVLDAITAELNNNPDLAILERLIANTKIISIDNPNNSDINEAKALFIEAEKWYKLVLTDPSKFEENRDYIQQLIQDGQDCLANYLYPDSVTK